MAHLARRRPENIDGEFYVDSSCIDCDTCRWMAPATFQSVGPQSAVYHQPRTPRDRAHALRALLACPTGSIGTVHRPQDVRQVQAHFPLPITDTVSHCGYHAKSSYGAASYFIQRPDGNVLVDSPRFAPPLVKRLEALGGIRYLYLTHRDDVADHRKFRQHFGCDRLLHAADLGPSTRDVEIPLDGDAVVALAPDLQIIPVPGHTRGHTVLRYREQVLFSGDHLAWSPTHQQLIAFRHRCWYDWNAQIESMQRLLAYPFEWVLPGHGRRYKADRATMHRALQHCIAWMQTVA